MPTGGNEYPSLVENGSLFSIWMIIDLGILPPLIALRSLNFTLISASSTCLTTWNLVLELVDL
jgi:hypothetical protein